METIFFLNQTFLTVFFRAYTSFVKPKNRLHRPKSSPRTPPIIAKYQYIRVANQGTAAHLCLRNTDTACIEPNRGTKKSGDDFGRWRRFFPLSKHFILFFFQVYTSFVKPKNRLHRPKSSPTSKHCQQPSHPFPFARPPIY